MYLDNFFKNGAQFSIIFLGRKELKWGAYHGWSSQLDVQPEKEEGSFITNKVETRTFNNNHSTYQYITVHCVHSLKIWLELIFYITLMMRFFDFWRKACHIRNITHSELFYVLTTKFTNLRMICSNVKLNTWRNIALNALYNPTFRLLISRLLDSILLG